MSLSDFEAHLKDPAPGFRCYASGDRSEKLAFLARVNNGTNRPADARTLLSIEKLLGPAAKTTKQFYAKHDGVFMYEDCVSTDCFGGEDKAAGITFFSVSKWKKKSSEMRESLLEMGWPEEEMTHWLLQGIAFAEIPHSANYFVIQPTGEDAGKIFYADHDSFEPDPAYGSFEEFLESILADPADFLYRSGCYTRYSDGKTDTQWIPKKYVANVLKRS